MHEPQITVVGNLVADPELRISNAGKPWVTFRIASTPRVKDKTGQWIDGEPLWLGCRAFGEHAENIAHSLTKGTRVIVQGRLTSRTYTDQSGQERTSLDLDVDEVGPGLRFATVQVSRANSTRSNAPVQQPPAQWAPPTQTTTPDASQTPAQSENTSPWGATTSQGENAAQNGFQERPF